MKCAAVMQVMQESFDENGSACASRGTAAQFLKLALSWHHPPACRFVLNVHDIFGHCKSDLLLGQFHQLVCMY